MVPVRKWRKVLICVFVVLTVLIVIYCVPPLKYGPLKFVPIQDMLFTKNAVRDPKWIVIDSDNILNDNINRMIDGNPQWRLLLVTEQNVRFENTLVLKPAELSDLFKSAQYINNKNYMRKNLGYLAAIARGAQIIYDASDSVRTYKLKNWYAVKWNTVRGVVFAGNTDYFNPYGHFGHPLLHPIGLPNLTQQETFNKFLSSTFRNPAIQHGMVSGNQNVGTIKETQLQSRETTVIFRFQSPPVLIPRNVFSKFNSDSTVFHYQALWALILPKADSQEEAEVLRSYWSQKLLWEIDGYIGFFPTRLNYEEHKNGVSEELPHKTIYVEFVNFLKGWTCPNDHTFFGCVDFLSFSLSKYGLWDAKNHDIIQAWIVDLKSLGYKEPQRHFAHPKSTSQKFKQLSETPTALDQPTLFYYSPNESGTSLRRKHFKAIRKMCPNHTEVVSKRAKIVVGQPPIKNVMLVVAFNTPFTKVIQKIHPIHALYFKHIVYCSNNNTKFEHDIQKFYEKVTFIRTYVGQNGTFHFMCLNRAMFLNFDVDGHLLIGDDVLLNSWNFLKAPTDKIWFPLPPMIFRYNGSALQEKWSWWNRPSGKLSYHAMWNHMSKILEMSPSGERDRFNNFRNLLKSNLDGKGDLYRAVSDVVYIPRRLTQQFIILTDFFVRHGVMVELAIPTIIGGLDHIPNFYRLKGLNLWYKSRSSFDKYKTSLHFMHPVKLFKVEMQKRKFMCSRYLPFLLQ